MTKVNGMVVRGRAVVFHDEVALTIGMNEAMMLNQIEYWLSISKNVRDGRKWVYKTFDGWQSEFRFFSIRTIKSAIKNLEVLGIIISSKVFNKQFTDRTKWYSIDYEKFNEIMGKSYMQSVKMPLSQNHEKVQKMHYVNEVSNLHHEKVQKMHYVVPEITLTKDYHESTDTYIVELDDKVGKCDIKKNPVTQIFDHWKAIMSHPRASLDPKRKNLIAGALKSFSVDDLKSAIDGCSKTPHNMGDNDRGEVYDGLHVIFKDAHQIERFIKNSMEPPKKVRKLTNSERIRKEGIEADLQDMKEIEEELEEEIRSKGGMDALLRQITGDTDHPF